VFGYIKPFVPDLRVREHELYRAVYCGLCRSMGRRTGCASRLTLSYDFAFLAALRMALEKTEYSVSVSRCAASPLKTRPIMEDNPALSYCAAVAAVLTKAKVEDDICDSKGLKKLSCRLLLSPASAMAKRALKYDPALPCEKIESALLRLSSLERECCPSLDTVADCFGAVLSAVFSHGLSGGDATVAAALGRSIGRIIYVLDAADDREEDEKQKSYNPLNLESVPDAALLTAVNLELSRAVSTCDLIDFEGAPEIRFLIYNILCEGIPREAQRIFDKNKKEKQ